jgi:hypothetical protein
MVDHRGFAFGHTYTYLLLYAVRKMHACTMHISVYAARLLLLVIGFFSFKKLVGEEKIQVMESSIQNTRVMYSVFSSRLNGLSAIRAICSRKKSGQKIEPRTESLRLCESVAVLTHALFQTSS